jgi:hypothetical protein
MTKTYLDTTVLVDAICKYNTEGGKDAKKAISSFRESLLPQYAIKEFKAGPLRRYVWFHNKIVLLGSYHKALVALQKISLARGRYASTIIEALSEISYSSRKVTLEQLQAKYGKTATRDQFDTDSYRLALKAKVFVSWEQRNRIAKRRVDDLACYVEASPSEVRKMIEIDPTTCKRGVTCTIAARMAKEPDIVSKMLRANEALPTSPEHSGRSSALKEAASGSLRDFGNKQCRRLGDAAFVFCCPTDAVLLTTNPRDHRPLADAIGKVVKTPAEVLGK